MADISDILEEVRDNDKAQQLVFKKAVSKGYYANTPAGQDLFNVDLHESHAPGAPTTGPGAPVSPPVPGQSYTVKQLQLANLYKTAYADNNFAKTAFKVAGIAALVAAVLGFGSCMISDDKYERAGIYGTRHEPLDGKTLFKGAAYIVGAIGAGAVGAGILKKKI